MIDTNLVTLRRFEGEFEANLICTFLQEAGIPATVEVDQAGAPGTSVSIVVDVRLVVPASHEREAELLVGQMERSELSEADLTHQAMGSAGGDWAGDGEDTDAEGPGPGPRSLTCPKCGSKKSGFTFSYYIYLLVMCVAFAIGLILRFALDSLLVGTIALLPALALLVWGFMNRNRIQRFCFNCDHRGGVQEFQPGDD